MTTTFTEEQQRFLDRFGFDRELFASWQKDLAAKTRSKAANSVTGDLTAPSPDVMRELPRQGTDEREELERIGSEAIGRGELGLVILNGGMATRFGGDVKGCVEVLPGRSFLELKVADTVRTAEACGGRVPIYLMNSFQTDEATKKHLEENKRFGLSEDDLQTFTQFVSVRMNPDGTIFATADGEPSMHGPGHGDFADAIRRSGCLKSFRDRGGKHLLVANVDNLGARVSPVLLGFHIQRGAEATVEVAPKWEGDVGGSPFLLDGKLQLVEQIRYPDGFSPDVVDVFNTNTFHFDAEALDREEGFPLGYYYVEKKVDGKVAIQFERLIGEMTRFLRSEFVRIKRTGPQSRFLPIKTREDLENAQDEIRSLYEGV